MEKFTKGEWFDALDGFVYSQSDGDCEKIAGVVAKNILPSGEEKANLALIAAAPEMYKMLKDIHEHELSVGTPSSDIERLLSKARGE